MYVFVVHNKNKNRLNDQWVQCQRYCKYIQKCLKMPNSTKRIKQRHFCVPGTYILNIQVKCAERMIWFPRCVALFMVAMDVKKEFYLEIESPLKMLDAKVVVCWELCEAYLINFTRLKRSLSFVYIVDKSSSKRSTELRENKNQINGNKFA